VENQDIQEQASDESAGADDSTLTIIFFADCVGQPGRQALSQLVREMREKHRADMVIANVENAAGGFGVTPEMSRKIFKYGVDVQTSGNHIWDRMDIQDYIRQERRLLRPANYPSSAPGSGSYVFQLPDCKVAVLNLMGRTFMNMALDCPFRTADGELSMLNSDTDIVIVDFHAEASSEKQALAHYLDGRVTAILGTHTHVQTADEKVSEAGTAYIGDTGMTGPHDSALGMRFEAAVGRFLTGLPKKFTCASEDVKACGVILKINRHDGKARSIERFRIDFDPDNSNSTVV
jgi:2',3'-cyclic-nucleotide 2'-phosphodiesterase